MNFDVLDWRMDFAAGALTAAAGLRVIHGLAYRDHERALSSVGLVPGKRADYYCPFDAALAPTPFIWTWMEIFAASSAASMVQAWPADLLAAIVIAGRFRALQEIGHIAVHFGLCRERRWQEGLTNAFFQFPLLKRSFRSRRQIHCVDHHRNPNKHGKDPNLARLIEAGLVPGLRPAAFWRKLFYPLGPAGLLSTLRAMRSGVLEPAPAVERVGRAVAFAVVCGLFVLLSRWRGLAWHFVLPLTFFYPWFSWLSLLTEHRWFAAIDGSDRVAMECSACRPTRFPGLQGALVGLLLMPFSDRFHLAHSLYPFMRWNHLPALDRVLRRLEPRYARFESTGLLFASRGRPAALSELRDRLCGRQGDVADWAGVFSRSIKATTR